MKACRAASEGPTASQNCFAEPRCHCQAAASFWEGGASFVVFVPAPSSIITKLDASKTFEGSFSTFVFATSPTILADFFRVLPAGHHTPQPLRKLLF